MISAEQAGRYLETAQGMIKGCDKLLETMTKLVEKEEQRRDILFKNGQGWDGSDRYQLRQVLKAVVATQRNQAAILRSLLEGYTEPTVIEGPIVVEPVVEGPDAPPSEGGEDF